MAIKKGRFLFLLLISCNYYISAQIIKVDQDWHAVDSVKTWDGVIDVTAESIKNTISIFQLVGSVQISHSSERDVILSASSLRLLYEENEALENAGYQHLRYIYNLDSVFSIEAFTQVQFDQLLKIKMRWVTGTGIRLKLLNSDNFKLYIRPGYMYEYEKEDSTMNINSNHRLSTYVTLRMRTLGKARFYFTLFYQPRLDDFSDFRLSPAWTIEMNVYKNLSVSLSGDYRYDTKPVAGVNKSTYILTQGFSWRF